MDEDTKICPLLSMAGRTSYTHPLVDCKYEQCAWFDSSAGCAILAISMVLACGMVRIDGHI